MDPAKYTTQLLTADTWDDFAALVEAYPEQVEDRKPQQGAYFHTGPETLFEEFRFERDRRIAKWRWVMRRRVAASTPVMSRPASPAGEQAARRRTAAQ